MPNSQERFQQVCQHARETALLESVESLLNWDERTMLPPSAGNYRAEQITYLSKLIHQRETDPNWGSSLQELLSEGIGGEPDSDQAATVRLLARRYEKQTKLPATLVEELSRTAVLAQQTWDKARKQSDFGSFQPLLEKTVELKQQQADALGYLECRYDALLDEYEPEATTSQVASVLESLREKLVPLVSAITGSQKTAPTELLKRRFPIESQATFGRDAAARIGFQFDRGRLDVTTHPFCSSMGPDDCRITTRYDESFFSSAFFGILHEAGHGIYDQGLRREQFGLPPGMFVSLGIHESQSRLWENSVGRSRSFWNYFFPQASKVFPDALKGVQPDDWYWAVNDVRPSLIRVEADEATYNLHIIIRFELEQALIDGDLAVADLPEAWNAKYQEYLGLRPPDDASGVLQDVHWAAGLFGYFPTYSLGNLYAAQLFKKAEKEIGALDERFSQGEFLALREWLRDKVHRHGQCFPAEQLMRNITAQSISSDALIEHLEGKLMPLYS